MIIAILPSLFANMRLSLLGGQLKPLIGMMNSPFNDSIKSIFLREHPVWKPIEGELEKQIPNSSANVSISTLYDGSRFDKPIVELQISLIVNERVPEQQLQKVSLSICSILSEYRAAYDKVNFEVTNFVSYTEKFYLDCNMESRITN